MRIVCIVQARTGSTRLPRKILKPLAEEPILWHDLTRLKTARRLDEVVIATTYLAQDDPVAALAAQCGVRVLRGDEDNVLSRYFYAAQMAAADVVVRVTSDCPLIDPATLDEVVDGFCQGNYDYFATPVPTKYPRGLDVEVFSYAALLETMRRAVPGPETEHVTWYIYHHQDEFRCGRLAGREPLIRPQYRLCVDTQEDYELLRRIYERLYEPGKIIPIEKVMALLDANPELARLNAHVQQKKV